MSRFSTITIITLLALCLSACNYGTDNSLYEHNTMARGAVLGATGGVLVGSITSGVTGAATGLVVGGVAGGLLSTLLEKDQNLVTKLAAYDIRTMRIGDNVKFILPADKFFHPGTPRLNVAYYPALNRLITLLNNYEKINVLVAGHMDNQGTPEKNLALSRQQAQNLANYLWSHGADIRILCAKGYGDTRPVADDIPGSHKIDNRRIEIVLRQLPVAGED